MSDRPGDGGPVSEDATPSRTRRAAQGIAGKVVVITGASAGLGERLAGVLAARGAHLVLAARRKERLERVAESVRARGRRALVVPCDVTSLVDLERLVAETERELGRCDVLINNAGIPGGGRFQDLSVEEIDLVTATDYMSVARLTRLFLPMLLASGGHIVNVASLAGRFATPGASAYTAAKHAVVALSESLYHELGPQGVMVTAVNPGFFESERFPHDDLKAHRRTRWMVMTPDPTVRAIVRAIEGRRGPEISVPRWVGPLQLFRMLVPPLYRGAVRRFTTQRMR